MTLLQSIKILLEITDESKDAILTLMIEDGKRAIVDYCHIQKFPKELEYVVRDVVVQGYQHMEQEGIASMQRGNTSISYQGIDMTSFNEKQRQVLHRYKKIILG